MEEVSERGLNDEEGSSYERWVINQAGVEQEVMRIACHIAEQKSAEVFSIFGRQEAPAHARAEHENYRYHQYKSVMMMVFT